MDDIDVILQDKRLRLLQQPLSPIFTASTGALLLGVYRLWTVFALPGPNSIQAERAFKLFEEANISTLHSLAQKVLYEMGPAIDFNPESISSFKDFKIKFASLLKSIPAEYLSNGQIRKHLNNPEMLLKKVHNLLGKPVELKTSAEFKENFLKLLEPFAFSEIEKEVRSLIPHFKKIEASSIEGFSSLKDKNFDAFLSWKIPLFENGEKLKKAPVDLSLSANLKKLLQDLKELQEQALSDETIINTLVFFAEMKETKEAKMYMYLMISFLN